MSVRVIATFKEIDERNREFRVTLIQKVLKKPAM